MTLAKRPRANAVASDDQPAVERGLALGADGHEVNAG